MCRPIWQFRWPVVGPHLFMATSCADDMTKLNRLRGSSSDICLLRARQRTLMACLSAKGGVHIVHTYVHGPLFDLHFGPFLLVLPTPIHASVCCRRHDFGARAVGFLGLSGFSGNVYGGVCSRRTIRRQRAGVWDPDSSSGAVQALVDVTDAHSAEHSDEHAGGTGVVDEVVGRCGHRCVCQICGSF